jgi:hypothetical protein
MTNHEDTKCTKRRENSWFPSCPSCLRGYLFSARLAGLVFLVLGTGLQAAPDYRFMLPSGTKNPSGLSLVIHDCGIDANGYRPIEIEVAPRPATKPFAFDRQVRVVLEFNRYGSQGTTQVSQVIELPEGSTGEKVTVLAPQTCGWSQLSVRTFEGGEKLLDLSQDYLGWPNTIGWSWTEARPAILFIDSNVPTLEDTQRAIQGLQGSGVDASPTYLLPDVRALLANFPDLNAPVARPGAGPTVTTNFTAPQISDTSLLALLWPRSRTEMTGFSELRARWLEMSQYDVVVISLADLQRLAKAHQDRFAALRDWLTTGPLLLVYGVGQDFERLEELERLLGLPQLPLPPGGAEHLRGWELPKATQNTGKLITPFEDYQNGLVDDAAADSQNTTAARSTEIGWPEREPFVRRTAGFGCVVALATEKPFPGRQADWAWLFNSVPENHWKWFRRTGFSLQRTNDDYWKFLIPGVGEAPVMAFMVLVSLFAIVIGPLNFYLLRRTRRLYLLLLTVPAGAALVTACLIAFALASDGVRVRLRTRSFTDLDQNAGRAVVWSRQSYYAALAPSQGLVFPEDTAVFPLSYEPGEAVSDRTTLLHWDGDQQLRRGYLAARTATQFMTCRATTSTARLVVTKPSPTSAALQVQNRLGTVIHYVVVRDSSGNFFAGEAIADGKAGSLEPIDSPSANLKLHAIAKPVEPADPQDYNPRLHNDNLFTLISGGRNHLPNSDSGAGDPLMSHSLLETNLGSYVNRHLNQPSDGLGRMQPGSYVAIVEHSPLVVSGIPHAREEASLHVIRGKY